MALLPLSKTGKADAPLDFKCTDPDVSDPFVKKSTTTGLDWRDRSQTLDRADSCGDPSQPANPNILKEYYCVQGGPRDQEVKQSFFDCSTVGMKCRDGVCIPQNCGNGVCDSDETITNCPQDCACTDPDTNDPYSGATIVTGFDWQDFSKAISRKDRCDGGTLIEYKCRPDGAVTHERYTCPAGKICSGGVCVGEQLCGRALIISFDDGYNDWADYITPILEEYNAVATGYIAPIRIGKSYFTQEKSQKVMDSPHWEIGSHTYNHKSIRNYIEDVTGPTPTYTKTWVESIPKPVLDLAMARYIEMEIIPSKDFIQQKLPSGKNVKTFAYPTGDYLFGYADSYLSPHFETIGHKGAIVVPKCGQVSATQAKSFAGGAFGTIYGTHFEDSINHWRMDEASRNNGYYFMYGHQVLPDRYFNKGYARGVQGNVMTDTTKNFNAQDFSTPIYLCFSITSCFRVIAHTQTTLTVDPSINLEPHKDKYYIAGPRLAASETEFRAILSLARKYGLRTITHAQYYQEITGAAS
ncbi:polysaccharide deacetylase family protein [Candidatus Woesearchaeota archaeon]|nr:polysaccharide deacetylase family protein [Candidatus Woesearchaeota archaeon]